MENAVSFQIYQYIDKLPPRLQEEVLHFVEYLFFRNHPEKEVKPTLSKPRDWSFAGSVSSKGTINQIQNLRDFAYE